MTDRSIISKPVDVLCVGGLSIVVIGCFLLLDTSRTGPLLFGNFIILTTLINAPHFIASYRLLYGSREMVKEYRWAAFYLPALLTLYCLFALYFALGPADNAHYANIFLLVMGYYLAVHYTGQTWGMMASFAYLDGLKFTESERGAFRAILKVLLGWQLVWFSTTIIDRFPTLAAVLPNVKPFVDLAAVAAALLGFALFVKIARRTGSLPPLRVVIPYTAICFWYLLLNRHPNTLFWVQLSHALQYLIFPFRVEMNRLSGERGAVDIIKPMLLYYGLMVVVGYIVFFGVEDMLVSLDSKLGIIAVLLTAIVNIHHYFIDGCIWKISNPRVRNDLFLHLNPQTT